MGDILSKKLNRRQRRVNDCLLCLLLLVSWWWSIPRRETWDISLHRWQWNRTLLLRHRRERAILPPTSRRSTHLKRTKAWEHVNQRRIDLTDRDPTSPPPECKKIQSTLQEPRTKRTRKRKRKRKRCNEWKEWVLLLVFHRKYWSFLRSRFLLCKDQS